MPTVDQIVAAAQGVLRVLGKIDLAAVRASPLSTSSAGSVTFMSKPVPVSEDLIARLEGAVLICSDSDAERLGALPNTCIIVVANPRLSFMRVVAGFFSPGAPAAGIDETARVDPTAAISPSATIGAYCVVGANCRIGEGSVLHPHVTLYRDVCLGRRVIVNSGTVIGADGFGYERNEKGELEKFPHIGSVEIEDDVEIGSNTSIDRGSLSATRIGPRARIDNQVHIAHNCDIGADAAVIAQAMLGGNVKIGQRAWLAPSCVVMNQVVIGDDATIGLGAVVTKNVQAGETVMGSPAQPDHEFRAARNALKALIANG